MGVNLPGGIHGLPAGAIHLTGIARIEFAHALARVFVAGGVMSAIGLAASLYCRQSRLLTMYQQARANSCLQPKWLPWNRKADRLLGTGIERAGQVSNEQITNCPLNSFVSTIVRRRSRLTVSAFCAHLSHHTSIEAWDLLAFMYGTGSLSGAASCDGGCVRHLRCRVSQKFPGTPDDGVAQVLNDPSTSNEVRAFYAGRRGTPAWVIDTSRLRDAVKTLDRAFDHGLEDSDYGTRELTAEIEGLSQAAKASPDYDRQLAVLDTRVTTALLTLGRDVAIGRTKPAMVDRRWKGRRTLPSLARSLNQVSNTDLKSWPDIVQPRHAEYAALQNALIQLRGQRAKGGWPHVPGSKFKAGDSGAGVLALHQRLTAGGFMRPQSANRAASTYKTRRQHLPYAHFRICMN